MGATVDVSPDAKIRMAALKAAASLGCRTEGRLLNAASTFERWIRTGHQ
jgi:hypothetical protein